MRCLLFFLLACVVVTAQQENVRVDEQGSRAVEKGYSVRTEALPGNEGGEKKKVDEIPHDRDGAVRLQIFLDQKHFGPGFIDGKPGMFTKLAIENYNVSLGRKKGAAASFRDRRNARHR